MSNLNYCQICGVWLGMDDYDGICCDCDDSICELCCGACTIDDWGDVNMEGDARDIPCPRCGGTGKEPRP